MKSTYYLKITDLVQVRKPSDFLVVQSRSVSMNVKC